MKIALTIKYEGDAVEEEAMDDAGPVQTDPFAVGSDKKGIFPEEASSSHLNFFDNVHSQIPLEDMSVLLGNLQPGAFLASSVMGDAMLHNSDFKPSLQEPVQADPFAVQNGQRDMYPEEAQVSHQNFFDNVHPQAPMEGMSDLQQRAFPVTRAEGDTMLHHSHIEPSLQESVEADPYLVQKDSFLQDAPVSDLNFPDNEHQPQAPMEGMSDLHGNLQPGAFPASPTEGDVMSHSSDLEPPSQEQHEAVPLSTVPLSVQPNIPQSIVEQPETLQNMAFSKGNVQLHHDSALDLAPSMMCSDVPPIIPKAAADNSESLQAVPPGVPTSIQQASVQHPEPLQDMALSKNDLMLYYSDLGPPLSKVPPGVSTSAQQASFQKPKPFEASLVPPGNLPSTPQAYGQQSEQLQGMARLEGDIRLHDSDVEPPPNMVPPGVPEASVQQPEPPQGMALPEGDIMLRSDLEPPPKMEPPGVPASISQASFHHPEPVQNIAENIPADADQNAYVKLPSHEKGLVDSSDHNPSMDSPSGTFKPSALVEPVQPPSLDIVPSEETELFEPTVVEHMHPHMPPKMEGQSQPSGKQESTVDGKENHCYIIIM